MSQENVEIVRRLYEAFNRGERDEAWKDAVPDMELDLSRALGPYNGGGHSALLV